MFDATCVPTPNIPAPRVSHPRDTPTTRKVPDMTANTTRRVFAILAIVMIAAALIGNARNTPANASVTTCPAGTYGIAGDWGPGSLRANTYANRVWVRRHYRARVAFRANHNIRPARCS